MEAAKAAVVSTSPGRMTGAAGALNAEAVDVTTANRAAVAVVVFMVLLWCVV